MRKQDSLPENNRWHGIRKGIGILEENDQRQQEVGKGIGILEENDQRQQGVGKGIGILEENDQRQQGVGKGIGVLDFTRPLALGDILLFIEHLKIKLLLESVDHLEIWFIADGPSGPSKEKERKKISSLFVPVIENYLNVSSYIFFDSLKSIEAALEKAIQKSGQTIVSPSKEEYFHQEKSIKKSIKKNIFDSTKYIQSFYISNGFIPLLASKKENIEQNKRWVERHAKGKISVVVHLKNKPGVKGESNADQEVWYSFFRYCHDQAIPACFILIGDDPISQKIQELPNIILSRKKRAAEGNHTSNELNLLHDLVLIEVTDMYMGMCSGPFQVAMLNRSPYIVFKNPEHHRQEMAEEIGDLNHYNFSAENQTLFREYETKEKLISEFSKILKFFRKKTLANGKVKDGI